MIDKSNPDKSKFFDLAQIDPKRHTKIREHLLWEFDLEKFDYEKGKSIVVERVVQRGNMDDWLTIFHLYGYHEVREQIKDIPYLNATDMNFVHRVFEIPLKELRSYRKNQELTFRFWEH